MVALARAPLLALAFVALAIGIAGGLARVTPLQVSIGALALHGPLMVSSFFGTLISLERAAALGRVWPYAAPLCAGMSGLLIALGWPWEAFVLMALAAAILFVATLVVVKRQPGLETATLAGGAFAWLIGNASVLVEFPAVPWWIAFLALTIGGERLELSRYLRRPPWVRTAFLVIAAAVFAAPLMPEFLGVMMVALALWLFAFDLARVTARQAGLPRYVAVCLLAGYFWLAVGGVLMALSTAYDAALHAVFLGFVFSMVFGHAPVILPAVLRRRFPYSPALYAPLVLLHGSLAVRVLLSVEAGAWGNAAAIVLFILTAAVLALKRAQTRS